MYCIYGKRGDSRMVLSNIITEAKIFVLLIAVEVVDYFSEISRWKRYLCLSKSRVK
jgi:hypothetical protein